MRARGRAHPSLRRARATHRPALATADGELAQDALDLLARVRRRLGQTVVQLDDGERLDEERLSRCSTRRARSPAPSPRADARTASTGRPPRSARNDSCSASRHITRTCDASELVANAGAAVAQLRAQLAQQRRRVVAEIRAVLLDPAVDLVGEARASAGLDRARGAPPAPGRRSTRFASTRDARRDDVAIARSSSGRSSPSRSTRSTAGRTSRMPASVRRRVARRAARRPPRSARDGARTSSESADGCELRGRARARGRSRRRLQDDRRSPAARAQRAPQRP